MAVAVCIPLRDIEQAMAGLTIHFPFLGTIESWRDSLRSVPDPSRAIMKLLESANLALAPLRPWLDAIEFAFAIVNCFNAVIDSLGPPPDPSALTGCISNLADIAARLIQYIPPLPYFRAFADILRVVIGLLDEVEGTIGELELQIQKAGQAINRGIQLDDAALTLVGNCSTAEVRAVGTNIMLLMQTIGRFVLVIIVIVAIFQDPGDVSDRISAMQGKMAKALGDICAADANDIDALRRLLAGIREIANELREILNWLYSILALPLGLPSVPPRAAHPCGT